MLSPKSKTWLRAAPSRVSFCRSGSARVLEERRQYLVAPESEWGERLRRLQVRWTNLRTASLCLSSLSGPSQWQEEGESIICSARTAWIEAMRIWAMWSSRHRADYRWGIAKPRISSGHAAPNSSERNAVESRQSWQEMILETYCRWAQKKSKTPWNRLYVYLVFRSREGGTDSFKETAQVADALPLS